MSANSIKPLKGPGWQPTNYLRFVRRLISIPAGVIGGGAMMKEGRVLQQLWEERDLRDGSLLRGDWIDVRIDEEQE